MGNNRREITIIDVCRDLGIEPTPELSWSVGAAVRDLYESQFGCLPPKGLRMKTSGPGSHCFALYPDEMRPAIEGIIRAHKHERARQYGLPF